MKSSTQILPGVKSIGWIDCRHLPKRVDLSAICGMPVAILTDIHDITFFDEPKCQCISTKDGAAQTDTATLSFLSDVELPDYGWTGFVVCDVNNRYFLIGSKENPLPVIERTERFGSPSGDAAGIFYEVKHVALKSLIPCIV